MEMGASSTNMYISEVEEDEDPLAPSDDPGSALTAPRDTGHALVCACCCPVDCARDMLEPGRAEVAGVEGALAAFGCG